jgi:hypothetical protein
MKWNTRILLVLASATVAVSPASVQAQVNYIYTTNNGALTIVSASGGGWGAGMLNIPGTNNGLPVVAMAPSVFTGNRWFTGIIITNGLTTIGDWNFVDFPVLTNVVLGSSVTNIGFYVFGRCPQLAQITVDPANPAFSSTGSVLFDQNQTTLIRLGLAAAGANGIT